MTRTNILLGAIAGVTIFLGLPVARWRGASERPRGFLMLASAGVLLFLIIEVGYHAMESVEATAKGASVNAALMQGLILVVGVLAGLVGLAWLESHRARQLKDNFIEYQDAHDFLRAARELLLRGRSDDGLIGDSRIAFDKLLNEVFTTLDPPDPNRPLPPAEVKALIERAERGLVR